MTEKENLRLDVIIPVYKPDGKFDRLLAMLGRQTHPVHRIIVINTEESFWNRQYEEIPNLEVHHVTSREYDHGGTRNLGASYSDGDVMVFMTDDAVPRDEYLLENLLAALERKGPEGETAAEAYARQLPDGNCRIIERYTRAFNYPGESRVKTAADLPVMGIKACFASNVCCAYRREIFRKLGGFTDRTIFNEDMIYAHGALTAGYAVVYSAEAQVVHSHNLSFLQQFRRNFDLAVSQADHPEVFGELPSEGEGIRMVKKTAGWLLRSGRFYLIPSLVMGSGCKYLGYLLGKRYRKLPKAVVKICTLNRNYWNR